MTSRAANSTCSIGPSGNGCRFVLAFAIFALLILPGTFNSLYGGQYFGNRADPRDVHVGLYVTAAAFIVVFAFSSDSRTRLNRVPRRRLMICALTAGSVVVAATLTSPIDASVINAAEFVLGVVGVIGLTLMVVKDADMALWAAKAIALMISLSALFGLLQFLLTDYVLFSDEYRRYIQRFDSVEVFRAVGTLDTPLVLGWACVTALPLIPLFERSWLRLALWVLLVSAVVLSGSRSAVLATIILVGIAMVRLLLAMRLQGLVSLILVGVVAYGTIALVVNASILLRLQSDSSESTTSIEVRERVLGQSSEILLSNVFWGDGAGASFRVSERLLSSSLSLENPLLMWSIDYGTVFAAGIHLAVIVFLIQTFFKSSLRSWRLLSLSCIVGIFAAQTFSSFATRSQVLPILCMLISLVLIGRCPELDGRRSTKSGTAKT